MLTRALLIHTDIHMYAHVTLSSFSDMVCDGPEGDRKGRGVDGTSINMEVAVADVNKMWASAGSICVAGTRW